MTKTKKLIIWLVVLVCLLLVVFLVVKFSDERQTLSVVNEQQQEAAVDLKLIKDNYELQIKNIMRDFLLVDSTLTEKDFRAREENVNQTLAKVIALKLTKEFKDEHLKLVIALEQIEEGYKRAADQEVAVDSDFDEAWTTMVDVLEKNNWLAD